MKRKTAKKDQHQHLLPASEVGQRFTSYYSHGWDFIEKTAESWTTIKQYPISPREIWENHQNPHKIIGLRFGSTTRVITIDLDRGSIYHPANNPEKLAILTHSLETIGLCRHVLIQSSHSEGIHLIIPLPQEVPTFKSACLVQTTLISAGFEIKKGQLEIFPNPKRPAKKGKITLYSGLRLPLQPNSGSYLLDDDLNITSDRVEDLLDQMDWAASGQDLDPFIALLDKAYTEYKAQLTWRKDPYSQKAQQWKQVLENMISEGWTGHHQTNYLLTRFVAYSIVFLKLQGSDLRETIKQQAINAPGYSQYCRHQGEIEHRIEEICYYTEKNAYYLPYCNYPERNTTFNQTYSSQNTESNINPQSLQIQTRLTETIAHLEAHQKLPQKVAQRRQAIQETAKELFGKAFSLSTLSKKTYRLLWHPQYRQGEKTTTEPESQFEGNTPSTAQPVMALTFANPPEKTPEPLPDKDLYPTLSESQFQGEIQTAETLTPTEVVLFSPIYEVFEAAAQKNQELKTTTNPPSSTPTYQPSSPAPEKTFEITSPEYLKRKAHIDANKQFYLNLGKTIPEGIVRLEAELAQMTPISEPSSAVMKSESKKTANDGLKADAVEEESQPGVSQWSDPSCERGTIPWESRKVQQNPVPDEEKPQKLTKKKLLMKCNDYGVAVNPTIKRLIMSNSVEVVSNALEALKEHKRDGVIHNPTGFLVKAIKEKWQPSEAPGSSSYPTGCTEEFLQWYKGASEAGIVEDLPAEWLPMYQNREPMVRILPPLGSEPYSLMRWHEARDIYPLPE